MVYPSPESAFESKIGFDKIRAAVAQRCRGSLAAAEALDMSFSPDRETVVRKLTQVNEMLAILQASLDLPLRDIGDVNVSISELRAQGSYIPSLRLYRLMNALEQCSDIVRFFNAGRKDGVSPYPELCKVAAALGSFPELIRIINASVNKFGEIKENASDTLYDLHKRLRAASGSVSGAMRRVLDRAIAAGIADRDTAPSIRDGRMVIPVDAANKRSIRGIVHDTSATGKTVYIEPLEVVEAGNRIRELEVEIKHEEIEILKNIAVEIRPYLDEILDSCRVLAKLEFIRAKADYAREVDGRMPNIAKCPGLEWYHAEHPQLLVTLRAQGKEVVPLTIKLDDAQRILIISGPNAGGKSVCLKTVGVVQYMTQCGLLPTLYENSHVGIFKNIFIDIGDEQSIENDLSTYSSHLRNMKYFLQHTDSRTLILADEMGSGTEPQIGGALAQAILEKLSATHCLGIVTTHYQNLKTFAAEHEGFVNGAMLYDRQHLQPTFQLSVGNPGSSFAIDIARKIGLDADVIENAREIVGSDYVNLDKYLLDIARDRNYWSNKRRSIKEKETRLDSLLSIYEDKADDLKSQRNAILHEAKAEAKEILAGANAQIERTIREIRNAQADKEKTRKIRTEFEAYRHSVEDKDPEAESETPDALKELKHTSRNRKEKIRKPKRNAEKAAELTPKDSFAAGDYVKMKDSNVVGQIIRMENKKAEVAFGALRTMVDIGRLSPATKPKQTAATQVMGISNATAEDSRRRQLNFKNEIDVRGMRGDEAVQAVIYFLDDAVQFSAKRLRILHGTGQGILKTLIRQQLNANPNVASFRDEDVRFGGAGITVVDLR